MNRPERRIAFVTGGSKGIGKEVVRGLAHKGVVVVIGARNVEALRLNYVNPLPG